MSAPIITEGDMFVSRWTLDPAKQDAFITMFSGLVENFRDAMGELTHFVFYGWSRKGEFVAIESWKSPDIVAQVRSDPGFVDLVSSLLDCCLAPMQMEAFSGMNSNRSIFDLHPVGDSTVHPRTATNRVVYI